MVLPASFDKWKASSTKSEISQFHVLVAKEISVLKMVMHVRSCCFTNVILMIFFLCRSRYRRRPRRLSSLQTLPRFFNYITWTI